MTRINNVDQVLLLLRERLQRMDRKGAGRVDRASAAGPLTPRAVERLQSLGGLPQLGEEEIRKALVRALLTEALGEGAAGDPKFQQVADRVVAIIEADGEGRDLLERAAHQLRGG